MNEIKIIADKEVNDFYREPNDTFENNLASFEQEFVINHTISRCLMYSYCKDSKNPIIFRHFKHWQGDMDGICGPQKITPDYCKLFLFIEGKFNFIIEDNIYSPVCGNVITIRNGEGYNSFYYELSNVDYYEIDFPSDFFENIPDGLPFYTIFFERETGQSNLTSLDHQATTKMFQRLEKIESLMERPPTYADFFIYSNLVQICALVSDAFVDTKIKNSDRKIPPLLKDALKYISENYLTLYDSKKVAEHCHISASYLCRLFKKALGTRPVEYINNQKISHAKYMLKNGHNVTDTCYASGFNSYSYFITTFKKNVGMTPTEYQKSENYEH